MLAAVWALAALGSVDAAALLVVNDLGVLGAGCLALSAAAGMWARRAAGALVVELGEGRHTGRPVGAQLAKVLADPGLEVLYAVPGLGWVDEQGRQREGPRDGWNVTRATAPQGGEVAIVHGDAGAGDPGLAQAAATAAALVLDVARLQAEVRARAADVRASRWRLLTVADAERRSLEARLADDVLAPLRRVERGLTSLPDATAVLGELRDAMTEVVALGRGLYPPALARANLSVELYELAHRCPATATVKLDGDLARIPERVREAAWFVSSEALTNVARHSHASHVSVHAHADHRALHIQIRDDGHGGATLSQGLRGLADRVEALGGTLTVDSPPGGPTAVRAQLPFSN